MMMRYNCRAVTYTGWDNLQIQYFKGFCITFPPLNLPSHIFSIHCFWHPLGQWPVTLLHTSSSLQCPHGVLQSLPWYWSRHTEKRFTLYNRSSLNLNKQTLRTIISENIFLWLSQYVFFFPFFLEYNFFSTFHIVCVLIVLYTLVFFNIDITSGCPNACLNSNYPTLVYLLHVDVLQPNVYSLPFQTLSIFQNFV